MKRILWSMILVCSCLAAIGAEPPIMGWSSWNTYRVNISDTLIMKQADALVKSGLGIDNIVLRDGDRQYTFLPYFAWDNRQPGKMKVWIRQKHG